MEISMVILAGAAIMTVSLIGILFVGRKAEAWLGERLSYLVAFSAGVFLVTGGAMTLEVFHVFEDVLWFGIAMIAFGYLGGWLIEYLLPESHHHHDPHDHDHHHGRGSARKIIIGDAIHNIGDGIMLVPAFVISPALGLAVTVSIMVHEALQEMSEFFVLKQAGYSTKKALLVNFVVSGTVFIGIGLAYLALATHELEGVLLAFGAGFFLHVVFHDLLPKRHEHESVRMFLQHLIVLVGGLVLMALLAYLLAGSHIHGEAAHDEELPHDEVGSVDHHE